VTAVFDVPANHPARGVLAENAIDDDGDVILRRVQMADGRTRVFVNDQPASVTLMRDIGRALVELHGQHDERALDPAAHRDLLDSFGGHASALAATGEAWRQWRHAEQELARHRAKVEAAAREGDYLRSSVEELTKLDPQPGEETGLAERRAAMMRAEKIASDIHEAEDMLSGSAAPSPLLAGLLRRLQRKAAEAPELLDDIVRAIDDALLSLDAAQASVAAALRAMDFRPEVLERAEERLFLLRAVARKHNVVVDDLAALRDTMAADLADLDAGAGRLEQLESRRAPRKAFTTRPRFTFPSCARVRPPLAQGSDGGTAGA
jgi:DNA repair protein RecN (Recombination protein N)